MSKPIVLTEEYIELCKNEFAEILRREKMFNGKVDYTKSLVYDDKYKAYIDFEPLAFYKMFHLLCAYNTEVAWHGVVERDPANENRFIIKDILVYPQVVTGGTVNTDEVAYGLWCCSIEDDIFNNIRMQGHSHVSMSTTPSAVDEAHQKKILTQIASDDYYIFMIWNKKFERTIKIFDLKNNILYEDKDVEITFGMDDIISKFLDDSKTLVEIKYNTTGGCQTGNYGAYQNGYTAPVQTPAATTKQAAKTETGSKKEPGTQKTKSKPKNGSPTVQGFGYCGIGSLYDAYEDDYDMMR